MKNEYANEHAKGNINNIRTKNQKKKEAYIHNKKWIPPRNGWLKGNVDDV